MEMELHSRERESNNGGFIWANLPLEISYLILDTLEWPTHLVCRRVCHPWRAYLDHPRLVAKRYDSPLINRKFVYKIRELDGTVATAVFEPPGQTCAPLKQIHRILTDSSLSFFINRDPKAQTVRFGEHWFLTQDSRVYKGSRPRNFELMSLKDYFPDADIGIITKMMFNPEYDEFDSGSEFERDGVEEYTPQPIIPWALRLDYIPFADEPIVLESPSPFTFEIRFVSLYDPQINVPGVQEYLRRNTNRLPVSPTVGELVIGIGKVIAEYFQKGIESSLDQSGQHRGGLLTGQRTGVYVSFRRFANDRRLSLLLSIDISIESACEWAGGEDEEEQDTKSSAFAQ
ncbi:hypothetical protein TWF718_007603 [Orbilia javanica]|uniref:F-box domain-containing protein n=1 Tax=Orbilia javanica TaxID=47235 RepID=A0AAN8MPJ0_9PEZI